MEGKQHRRFYLITYPRTASNLLVRILALQDQPNVASNEVGGYFFRRTMFLYDELRNRGKHVEEWTQDEKHRMMQCYQECFNGLEEFLQKAEAENKIVFAKEHGSFMSEPTAHTRFFFGPESTKEPPWTVQVPLTYGPKVTRSSLNETVLPDEFLRTWLPTFLIRHPALVVPSYYRVFLDMRGAEATKKLEVELLLETTLHWPRTLYDWYAQHLSESKSGSDGDITWPLVVDADDIMTEPDVVIRLCEIVGMDPAKLQFKWAPASEEQLAQLPSEWSKRLRSTLSASTGIVRGKTSADLDIGAEAKKWREEFGESEGEKIEKWVRKSMPDYEFLKAKRLRPRPA